MPKATIFIEDNAEGSVNVGADFGDAVDEQSQAHGMAMVLLQSILTNAKTYTALEDTVPDVNVEPSKIIVPGSIQ